MQKSVLYRTGFYLFTFISNDMIQQHSGKPNIESYKKTASTAFAFNDVVTVSSGLLVKATASTPRDEIIGLIQRTVLATDADYASQTAVPVLVLDNNADEFIADVGTGTAVQSMVGSLYDLKDENELDVSAQLVKAFRVTKVISTTKVVGRFETSNLDTTA
jgi:hydroxyethylthiazole kinase-like sugar kinase family protein